MRRKDKEIINTEEMFNILQNGKFATISMCQDNEPYIVTLNYGYDRQKNSLYFHCAKEGLKLKILKSNPKACGTVIEDFGYVMNECNHSYRSVVFGGKINIVEELEEKKIGLNIMLNHLEENPSQIKEKSLKNEKAYNKPCILRFDIDEVSGKDGRVND